MQQKFKLHQIVYMIVSGKKIKEMVVMKYSGGFYVVRYRDTGGGLRVRESRLYATKAEAEKAGGIGPGNKPKKEEEYIDWDQITEKYYTPFLVFIQNIFSPILRKPFLHQLLLHR